jgi:hypothetical protein
MEGQILFSIYYISLYIVQTTSILTILSYEMVQLAAHVELYDLKYLVVVWFTGGFLAG